MTRTTSRSRTFSSVWNTFLAASRRVSLPSRPRRRWNQTSPVTALCERFESRQLLSATGFMLENGVLEFHGQASVAESVTLDVSTDQTQIVATSDSGGNVTTSSYDISAVDHFRFVGKEMTDSLTNNTSLPVETLMTHGSHGHHMLAEMEAMFDLVRYGAVTHTAVQSGGWLDPATWGGAASMPTDGARVLVPAGLTVTVDGTVTESLMTIRVDGTLNFATDTNTELRVDTVVINMGGAFEMGTDISPVDSSVTARLIIDDYNNSFETTDATSPDYDPYKLGNGLISHGQVSIQGSTKTSGVTLATEPSTGDTQLVLDNLPADWNVGDELIVAGTTSTADGDEVRTITAIDQVTGTVTLNAALSADHHTPTHTRTGVELQVHVGNTTRNAIIETATEHRGATATVTVPTGDTTSNRTGDVAEGRGHVMFMHSNNVQLRNAGFYHLGRTSKLIPVHDTAADMMGNITEIGLNPRARYAVHFHRAGTATAPGIVENSAVVNTPGWGFVNHSSHVDMTSNISHDVVGAGFVTEAGDEAGSFVGNLSIRNNGSGVPTGRRKSVDDFGHGGHGFWFQGTGITVRDNVASGSSDAGIAIWPIGIDGLGDTVRSVPLVEFTNNRIYGSNVGFLVGQHEESGDAFVNTTIYGVNHGLEFFYPESQTYTGTTIIGDLDNPTGTGIKMQHRAGPFQFNDTHIEGFARGFETPRDNEGNVIDGAYLNNVENFVLINGRRHFSLGLTLTGDVQFGTLTAAALAGRTQYNFALEESESAPDIPRYAHLILPYNVTLDYDGLTNPYRIYFDAEQSPDHIVWPTEAFDGVTPHSSNSDIPVELRGKTNAELQAIFAGMTDAERVAMLSSPNQDLYERHPDSYYSFAGGIRPADAELTFPADIRNGALLALDASNEGLILDIDFNDGTAGDNAPDANDNSGTLTPGATINDGEVVFDGTGGITIGSSSVIDNMTVQQRTISLSFMADDVTTRQVLFEEGGTSKGLNIYIDNGSLYVGAWDRGNGFAGTFLSTSIVAGQSYSVSLILDATETLTPDALRGYLDGQLFGSGQAQQIKGHGSGTAFGSTSGKTRFHDGRSSTGVEYNFAGRMDHLRIYNRVLFDAEIVSLYDLRLIDDLFSSPL